MSKLAALTAVLALAVAGSALAAAPMQDLRPPAVHQDLRSPDARESGQFALQNVRSPAVQQDLRSPDARESGLFAIAAPQTQASTSSSVDWGYIVGGAALALLIGGGIAMSTRHRRHRPATGI